MRTTKVRIEVKELLEEENFINRSQTLSYLGASHSYLYITITVYITSDIQSKCCILPDMFVVSNDYLKSHVNSISLL